MGWHLFPLQLQTQLPSSLELTTTPFQSANLKFYSPLRRLISYPAGVASIDSINLNAIKNANTNINSYLNRFRFLPRTVAFFDRKGAFPHKNATFISYNKPSIPISNLKNKNLSEKDGIAQFINNKDDEETVKMVLTPVAKAIAGGGGEAMAVTVSKAILLHGTTNVDIIYKPEAVAIAGPGGIAHAQNDLQILYEEPL